MQTSQAPCQARFYYISVTCKYSAGRASKLRYFDGYVSYLGIFVWCKVVEQDSDAGWGNPWEPT